MTWEPITNAPSEKWCLVYTNVPFGAGNKVFVAKRALVWGNGVEEWIVFKDEKFPYHPMSYMVSATHWMPLPEPPKEGL